MTADDGGTVPAEPLLLDHAPDADGFRALRATADGRFLDAIGVIGVRVEGAAARCRVDTGRAQSNIADNVHGGFILAFIDQVMFAALLAQDRLPSGGAVTVQVNTNFIAASRAGRPIDAVVEVVGETGRMLFLRGTIEQDGVTTGAFDGILRKLRAVAPA